jgi:hypothetical protein
MDLLNFGEAKSRHLLLSKSWNQHSSRRCREGLLVGWCSCLVDYEMDVCCCGSGEVPLWKVFGLK